MESTKGDLSIVKEQCLMLQRRNEALTAELQAVKASGWSAVRDAEDKSTTISEMSAQQKELEQQISFYQQRLAERCVHFCRPFSSTLVSAVSRYVCHPGQLQTCSSNRNKHGCRMTAKDL
jgi:hypothetical protein